MFENLKRQDEGIAAQIEPLQEAASILAQVIGKKQGELEIILETTKVKLEEPVSGQLVEDMKARGSEVTVTIADCKVKYDKLR